MCLDLVRDLLFDIAKDMGWGLHAWAILSNHYHFIAASPEDASTLRRMLSKLHTLSARELNVRDRQPGRKVWFQFFDSHVTFTNSYLARLNYVHNNPVHHGIVNRAEDYPWCSAGWFARTARPAFRKTVVGFKTDTVRVPDAFDAEKPGAPRRDRIPQPGEGDRAARRPHRGAPFRGRRSRKRGKIEAPLAV